LHNAVGAEYGLRNVGRGCQSRRIWSPLLCDEPRRNQEDRWEGDDELQMAAGSLTDASNVPHHTYHVSTLPFFEHQPPNGEQTGPVQA
jgi:hypothetical protein